MQPISSVTVRRPFHWGIAVVAAPDATDVPDVDPGVAVTGDEHGVVVLVRHAQDVEATGQEPPDDVLDLAEAEIHVRLLADDPEPTDRRVVYRGLLRTPDGLVGVGDADGEVVLPAHPGWTCVVVTVGPDVAAHDLAPDAVRVDLSPDA